MNVLVILPYFHIVLTILVTVFGSLPFPGNNMCNESVHIGFCVSEDDFLLSLLPAYM